MIEFQDVTFGYPRQKADIIHEFSHTFCEGEIVAVTGSNGCGKTTLTRLLNGILRPKAGSIRVDGEDIAGLDLFMIGQKVGSVFQNVNRQLFCPTVFEEIAYGLKNKGQQNLEETVFGLLDEFGLSAYADTYPPRLSMGEKQRVVLAAVLALGTKYLVLDEPTTGLDIYHRHKLGGLLKDLRDTRGCGIIFVSHERSFIEKYADRELRLV